MAFYLVERKRHSWANIPRWMIVRSIGYQEYVTIYEDSEYQERNKNLRRFYFNYASGHMLPDKQKWTKKELNKKYHICPISEEDAATKIFLDS